MFHFCSQTHYLTLMGGVMREETDQECSCGWGSSMWKHAERRVNGLFIPAPQKVNPDSILSHPFGKSSTVHLLPWCGLSVNAHFNLSELFILPCKYSKLSISLWPLLFSRISLKWSYLLLFMLSYFPIINTATDEWQALHEYL